MANRTLRTQNLLLLAASYYFYACWDWRFLFLLLFSTLLDYWSGLQMSAAPGSRQRKGWFWLSVVVNAGFLGLFKYYNFFAASFAGGLSHLGFRVNIWTLQVILPVGISFYTFHGLSYVIDIYKGRIKAERNFVDYALFVSFFPLLVAGPIERATHLLPQLRGKRKFDYTQAVDGVKQILWGLFKKVVIADSCAEYVNTLFHPSAAYSGSAHAVGALFFAFQIYCDFSGYSDIALGTARLFGIDLLRNFAFPYFSRDIAEFWRRWHISLSSWWRDYLYIPLGGSKGGTGKKIRNILLIFLVSGFWHGANWTFIAWGLLNALYILPSVLMKTHRRNLSIVAEGKVFPSSGEFFSMVATFGLTVLAWIFFRAESVGDAIHYVRRIFSRSLLTKPVFPGSERCLPLCLLIVLFLLIEWQGREQQYAIQNFGAGWRRAFKWSFYYTLLLLIYYFSVAGSNAPFIYFQF